MLLLIYKHFLPRIQMSAVQPNILLHLFTVPSCWRKANVAVPGRLQLVTRWRPLLAPNPHVNQSILLGCCSILRSCLVWGVGPSSHRAFTSRGKLISVSPGLCMLNRPNRRMSDALSCKHRRCQKLTPPPLVPCLSPQTLARPP